jgi:hypothetical protein
LKNWPGSRPGCQSIEIGFPPPWSCSSIPGVPVYLQTNTLRAGTVVLVVVVVVVVVVVSPASAGAPTATTTTSAASPAVSLIGHLLSCVGQ